VTVYDDRLTHVRDAMVFHQVDTLILGPGASMRYITGFSEPGHERFMALIVPRNERPLFVMPSLNAAQARENPGGIDDVRVWDDDKGWESLLAETIVDLTLDIGVVAVDDDMPARFILKLQHIMPTTFMRLASKALDPLRTIKDTLELAALQHAADATDALIPVAFAACKEGITERAVAQAIDNALADAGHTTSFDSIVAAGPNGASPHHHTGRSKLKRGDIVVLDFGANVEGYCGDITRVVAVGEASDEARKIYDIVYRAHLAAVEAVQPGATGHDVDTAARRVIAEAGYGEFFLHRTGHGIGMECHENPNIVGGNRVPLLPGNCFSIEPGIYLPGKFGVRLENIVTITDDGHARVFNKAIPPELPVV
jgi:Xaa-Pro dipeptidase